HRGQRPHRGEAGQEGDQLGRRDGSRDCHGARDRGVQQHRHDRGPARGRASVQRETQAPLPGQIGGVMSDMTFQLTDEQRALKSAVYELCKQYPPEYWRDLDAKREYPEAFVNELTKAGYLAALIPQEYGGAGLGMMEAAIILEEINHSGGNAAACHA